MKNLASLKLKGALLNKLTRKEVYSRIQLVRTIDPIVNKAYRKVEEEAWKDSRNDSPHGLKWHTSFHASQFPPDDGFSCPRKAVYGLADFPDSEPTSRTLRQLASAGKGIEVDLVRTFHEAGILISASPDDEFQTGFEMPEYWLTGSVDSIILPDGWNMPLVIEIKSKYQSVIDEMRLGVRGPDREHINQIKVQLAMVRKFQKELWPDLEPLTHGYIYYMSRDKPSDTAEFRIDYDPKFFQLGVEKLKEYKDLFLQDKLVSINPSKRHPMGWRWSYYPCQFCKYKKTCQLDHQHGTTKLSESVGIARSQRIRETYDFNTAKERVINRWKNK